MNEQTNKLIEQLAQKLGTTTEYLWSILIKQASISAITDLMYCIFVIISGFILLKVHMYLGSEKDGKDSIYYEKEEAVWIPMAIALAIWVIMISIALCSVHNIVNGFFNPEYWALNKILSSIRN